MARVERVTLDNGLRVVIERRESSVVGIAAVVAAGSYADPPGLEGLAHLTEHMLFRSNEKYSAVELDRIVELSGGSANAYTGRTHMVVHLEAVAGSLARMADVLASMVSCRVVVEEELEREKSVVLSEVAGYRSDERAWIHRLAAMAALGGRAGRPIEGSPESVSRVTPRDVERFRDRLFRAGNMVVGIAGAFSRDELGAALDVLEGIPEGGPVPVEAPPPSPGDVVEERGSQLAQVALAYPLPPLGVLGERVWDVRVAAFNLAGGVTSPLYEVVRVERGLAYSYYLDEEYNVNASFIAVVVEDVQKDRVEEAVEAVEEAWSLLESRLGDPGYVEGRRRFLRYLSRPESLSMDREAALIAEGELLLGKPLPYEERLELMMKRGWGPEAARLARGRGPRRALIV